MERRNSTLQSLAEYNLSERRVGGNIIARKGRLIRGGKIYGISGRDLSRWRRGENTKLRRPTRAKPLVPMSRVYKQCINVMPAGCNRGERFTRLANAERNSAMYNNEGVPSRAQLPDHTPHLPSFPTIFIPTFGFRSPFLTILDFVSPFTFHS